MLSPEANFLVVSAARADGLQVEQVLQSLGYGLVTMVENGETALKLAARRDFDALIISRDLPDMQATDLASRWNISAGRNDRACLILAELELLAQMTGPAAGISAVLLPWPASAQKISAWLKVSGPRQPESSSKSGLSGSGAGQDGGGLPEENLAGFEKALQAEKRKLAGLQTEIGLVMHRQGRLAEAIAALEEAVKADPGLARAQAGLGRAYQNAGRTTEAAAALEKAFSLDPHSRELQETLAEAVLENGDHARAETLFHDLLEGNPRNLHLFNRLGISLRKQGKFEQALSLYRQALEIDGRDENLLYNMGRCHLEAGQREEAEVFLQKALEINPNLIQARKLLAVLASAR